jgi:hypothetical protein
MGMANEFPNRPNLICPPLNWPMKNGATPNTTMPMPPTVGKNRQNTIQPVAAGQSANSSAASSLTTALILPMGSESPYGRMEAAGDERTKVLNELASGQNRVLLVLSIGPTNRIHKFMLNLLSLIRFIPLLHFPALRLFNFPIHFPFLDL